MPPCQSDSKKVKRATGLQRQDSLKMAMMYLAVITVSRHIHRVSSWKNDPTSVEIKIASSSSSIIHPPARTCYKQFRTLLLASMIMHFTWNLES
ncbi:hypothetical protein BT96DRAFT_998211 [Gymnopus androsaceus JB14]|uniref:Uncharacterized protein n=1 Tax=Gymnopus androsaceus JB14 TaxID=1447944 RepID=A0A6A4HAY3_9AGAR|nr:hypothetical protein BT96DRAFT_998211 [Gymnopus androsaceus JB14]